MQVVKNFDKNQKLGNFFKKINKKLRTQDKFSAFERLSARTISF